MEFLCQEYWSGLSFLLQRVFPGIETVSPASSALAGRFFPLSYLGSPNTYKGDSVLVTQLCPTLCNPKDCSLPGSSVRGVL